MPQLSNHLLELIYCSQEESAKKDAAKKESSAKKLESFKNSTPDKKSTIKKPLFTQLKDVDDVKSPLSSPTTSAKLLSQSQSPSVQKST